MKPAVPEPQTTIPQGKVRELLLEALAQAQARNPSLSLRAYARKLGVPAPVLSEVLRGKRRITARLLEKLLPHLRVGEDDLRAITGGTGAIAGGEWKDLQFDAFRLISDWHPFAILSLAETEDFQSNPSWIAKRLGLSLQETKASIDRLLKLGLLAKKGDALIATGARFQTPNGVANLSIRKNHLQALDLARDSLQRDPVEKRDFSGITMAVDPARLPEAKKRIEKFRKQMCRFLEGGAKKKVYRMNVQLFPLCRDEETQNETKENEK